MFKLKEGWFNLEQMSAEKYDKLINKVLPRVAFSKTGTWAFLIGGTICAIGELFRLLFFNVLKFDEVVAGTCVCCVLIFFTAVLTGFGLFHKIAQFGGAGTFVPITGFANSVVSPALEFKTEGLVLGACSKMFVIAGPVIVYGIVSAMVAGLIFQICLFFGVVF